MLEPLPSTWHVVEPPEQRVSQSAAHPRKQEPVVHSHAPPPVAQPEVHVEPDGQSPVHAPMSQVCPGEHAVVQLPHVAVARRSASQPFASMPSQSSNDVLHELMEHAPAMHDAVAFARTQAALQPPQWASVERPCSHPSAMLSLQLPQPPSQTKSHAREMHEPMAWALVQLVPQAPQLAGASRDASHPVSTIMSQFAYPPSHRNEQLPPSHVELA